MKRKTPLRPPDAVRNSPQGKISLPLSVMTTVRRKRRRRRRRRRKKKRRRRSRRLRKIRARR
ncbi:hypothetical protein GDO81_027858 [Engystomops pustulosus]|uniref:Uncharacterized protein n=1 Tax=Engystomops pustulosus TaxID=76066 RepID=A0AAV6YKL1_ENGPU|nr:hypothetical protein GDO81_027858 [Engystomops pustulosus]